MKTSILHHAIWLFVAVTAFGLGSFNGSKSPLPGATSGTIASSESLPESAILSSASDMSTATLGSPPILPPTDGLSAIQEALTEADPVRSNLLFARALQHLTSENIEQAIEAVRNGASDITKWQQLGLYYYAWGTLNGPASLESLQANGERSPIEEMAALAGWTTMNPSAALQWVESLEGTDPRKATYRKGLVYGLAQHDLGAATDYVMSVPATERKIEFVAVIAQEYVENGLDQARGWVDSLSDQNVKAIAMTIVAKYYAREDLAEAAAWVTSYGPENYSPGATSAVAREWARKDPVAALQWATGLSEGYAQNIAAEAIFRQWVRSDAKAAGEYLIAVSNPSIKNAAISDLATTVSRQHPEAAMSWAYTISEPTLRERTIIRVGRTWYLRDPATASAWLGNSGLPARTKAAIAGLTIE